MADEQSTIIVHVIDSFVVVNDGLLGAIVIDQADGLESLRLISLLPVQLFALVTKRTVLTYARMVPFVAGQELSGSLLHLTPFPSEARFFLESVSPETSLAQL